MKIKNKNKKVFNYGLKDMCRVCNKNYTGAYDAALRAV